MISLRACLNSRTKGSTHTNHGQGFWREKIGRKIPPASRPFNVGFQQPRSMTCGLSDYTSFSATLPHSFDSPSLLQVSQPETKLIFHTSHHHSLFRKMRSIEKEIIGSTHIILGHSPYGIISEGGKQSSHLHSLFLTDCRGRMCDYFGRR